LVPENDKHILMNYFVKNSRFICNITVVILILFNLYYFVAREYTNIAQYVENGFHEIDPILERTVYQDLSEEYFYLNKNYEKKSVIVFLGDSITKRLNTAEYFNDVLIINRGIPFDTTYGLKKRLSQNIKNLNIEKLFIMIGFNDLRYRNNDEILKNFKIIFSQIKAGKVFVQSILPVDSSLSEYNARIVQLNCQLKTLCEQTGFLYIELHSYFLDKNGGLSAEYTHDGVHLNRNGNLLWAERIYSLLMDKSH